MDFWVFAIFGGFLLGIIVAGGLLVWIVDAAAREVMKGLWK